MGLLHVCAFSIGGMRFSRVSFCFWTLNIDRCAGKEELRGDAAAATVIYGYWCWNGECGILVDGQVQLLFATLAQGVHASHGSSCCLLGCNCFSAAG